MNATRQWLVTILAVIAALLAIGKVNGETIFDIQGVFAPALTNQATTDFVGTLTFPNDVVNEGFLSLRLAAEPDIIREVPFAMALNLPGSIFQPWDTRLFAGVYNEEPMTMIAVDYQMTAGDDLSALTLDTAGWDGWLVSFPDWPAGSVSLMTPAPIVNEPAGLALLAVGGIILFAFLRHGGGG